MRRIEYDSFVGVRHLAQQGSTPKLAEDHLEAVATLALRREGHRHRDHPGPEATEERDDQRNPWRQSQDDRTASEPMFQQPTRDRGNVLH
jgi:hypothetical protein